MSAIATILATFLGMFVAGYLGLYEVLVEFILITWTITTITNTVLEKQKKKNFKSNLLHAWKWFFTFKSRKVQQVLEGHTILPFLQVVLLGWAFGWIIAIVLLFFQDWQYVISREIKETILDIVISISLIKFVTLFLKYDYELKENDDEPPNYHPADPDAYDALTRYAEAQGAIAVPWAKAFFFLKSSITLTVGIALYLIGFIIQHKIRISFLDNLSNWQI